MSQEHQDTRDTTDEGKVNASSSSKSFRFTAKKVFLTYAQCDAEKQDVLDHVSSKHKDIDQYIIGQEKHADGNPHLHAYFSFKSKINIKNPRHFDVKGFHPKIESVRAPSAAIKYCQKEGNYFFVAWGASRPPHPPLQPLPSGGTPAPGGSISINPGGAPLRPCGAVCWRRRTRTAPFD